jgi:hypothetical protein
MLVLIAGTHGVEGHCGSGAEIAWMRSGGPAKLPENTGALLIHALNPYGFAWTRRVTEDNVDLNRNFVDHDKGYPKNEGYLEIADSRPAGRVERGERRRDRARVRRLRRRSTAPSACRARSAAASTAHPDGIFFGGNTPSWSNRTIRAIAREELSQARRVGIVDFHTGLGPFGHGELICAVSPAAKSFARAKAWYGDEMTSPEGGTSTSAVVVGVMTDAFPQELPDAEVTPVALEYGTYTVPEVLNAVRADNWLHHRGDLGSAPGPRAQGRHQGAILPRPATSGARWYGRAPTRPSAGR